MSSNEIDDCIMEQITKPDPPKPPCTSPQHNPPMHMYIPPGTVYVHTCPVCGFTWEYYSPIVVY